MVDIVKPDISSVWAEAGAVIAPSNEKIKMGWTSEVPPHQYENFVQNRQDEMLAYLNQKGVPEWRIDTEYFSGKSFVQDAGKIYKANKNSGGLLPNQKPSTDATNEYWEQATFSLSDLKQAVGASTKDVMSQKAVTDALSTKANTSTQVIAGTGLSGGGNLSANRTLSVNYGTTAGTAAQGNDSRITGAAQKEANLSDLSSAPAARQNLGLGTAATRDVGEDNGDLMPVGAFGLGGSGAQGQLDLNDVNYNGIHARGSGASNYLFGLAGGFALSFDYDDDYAAQLATNLMGSRWGVRGKSEGVWGPWKELIHTGNPGLAGIGVGQSWQDVTTSRELGVTYTNTTGRAIFFAITFEDKGSYLSSITVGGVEVARLNLASSEQVALSAIVPNGVQYSASGGGGNTKYRWTELR